MRSCRAKWLHRDRAVGLGRSRRPRRTRVCDAGSTRIHQTGVERPAIGAAATERWTTRGPGFRHGVGPLTASELYSVPKDSQASSVNMQNRVAAALEQPYEDLRGRLESEPQVFMDETPTKQANENPWLWTAVTSTFAVFAVFSSRVATAPPIPLAITSKESSTAIRQKMYWRTERLHWCRAHLSRDIQALGRAL